MMKTKRDRRRRFIGVKIEALSDCGVRHGQVTDAGQFATYTWPGWGGGD